MEIYKDGVLVEPTEQDLLRYRERAERRAKAEEQELKNATIRTSALKKIADLGLTSEEVSALFGR